MFDGTIPMLLAFLVVAASPGPANIAAATVAMRFGRGPALLFGFGLSAGLAVWGLVAASGLGALLQASPPLLVAMKVGGGLYLLWLAFLAGRSAAQPHPATPSGDDRAPVERGRWFRRSLILNLSNPKAVVAWMAVLAMGLDAGTGPVQVALVTALCIAIGILNYTAHAVAFSTRGLMAGYRRLQRWIEGAVACLFALAGFGLIRSAFSR